MSTHKSVLLKESIESLNIKPGDVVVDATLGGGGHSLEILKKIGNLGRIIAFDLDPDAIENFKKKIKGLKPKLRKENILLINDNFKNIKDILISLGIENADALIADFGISSDQLSESKRGFSFQKDEPLDMRMNGSEGRNAQEIINSYSEEELRKIFTIYGEEKYSKNIAKNIVKGRRTKPIITTYELISAIASAVPEKYKHQRIHFATKIFQALRIEVNNELDNIKIFIPSAIEILNKGGRLAVITFHSGEDKIAKNIFRENARGCICPPNFPICQCGKKPVVKIISKKPILPSAGEIEENPRARSAKLRVIEKI